MASLSFEESRRQIEALAREARAAEQHRDWHAAVAALERLVAHPCAHHQVIDSQVWDEIHQLRRRVGDLDGAIAAKQRAIEAGCRSVPDPEADIAECAASRLGAGPPAQNPTARSALQGGVSFGVVYQRRGGRRRL